jgi:hypothetical protein
VWVISISSNVVGNPIWNHQQGRDRAIYLRHINYWTPCISWSPCMGYCHIFYDHKTLRAHCTAQTTFNSGCRVLIGSDEWKELA